jgi:hypothetical protein
MKNVVDSQYSWHNLSPQKNHFVLFGTFYPKNIFFITFLNIQDTHNHLLGSMFFYPGHFLPNPTAHVHTTVKPRLWTFANNDTILLIFRYVRVGYTSAHKYTVSYIFLWNQHVSSLKGAYRNVHRIYFEMTYCTGYHQRAFPSHTAAKRVDGKVNLAETRIRSFRSFLRISGTPHPSFSAPEKKFPEKGRVMCPDTCLLLMLIENSQFPFGADTCYAINIKIDPFSQKW